VRHLTADELRQIASELGAEAIGEIFELTGPDRADATVLDTASHLLVTIVRHRPFDRRNDAIAVTAAALVARLNGCLLDLEPPDAVVGLLARIRDGLPVAEVVAWLSERASTARQSTDARCPACSMPVREALDVTCVGSLMVAACGGCGRPLAPAFHHRPLQEV
jgi:hypothetical protein